MDFNSFRVSVQCWKCAIFTGTNCMYDMYADRLHERFPLDIHTTSGSTICYFKLTASVGHLIRLSIVSLHIEADNCITDSLTIYDSLMPITRKILYRWVHLYGGFFAWLFGFCFVKNTLIFMHYPYHTWQVVSHRHLLLPYKTGKTYAANKRNSKSFFYFFCSLQLECIFA